MDNKSESTIGNMFMKISLMASRIVQRITVAHLGVFLKALLNK